MTDLEDTSPTLEATSSPLEIPEGWAEEAVDLYGEEGAQSLIAALQIYREYSPAAFNEDVAVQLDAATRTAGLQEVVMQGFVKTIQAKYLSKQGLLKEDPLRINLRYQKHLTRLNSNIFLRPKEILEGNFAEDIHSRNLSYLLTLFAINEGSYRRKNENELRAIQKLEQKLTRIQEVQQQIRASGDPSGVLTKEKRALIDEIRRSPHCQVIDGPNGSGQISQTSNRVFAKELFELIDHPELFKMAFSGEPDGPSKRYFLESVRNIFMLARDIWAPFLNGNNFKGVENTSAAKMKEDNDRVFQLLMCEDKREIDMCTADDNNLLKGRRLVIQLSPITEEQGKIYLRLLAQANYHGESQKQRIVLDRALQEQFRATRRAVGDATDAVLERVDEFPGVHVNRHNGEIEGLGIYHEGVKLLAKDQRAYEAIRRDVLFFLANLTCSPVTLVQMFGEGQKKSTEIPKPKVTKGPGSIEPGTYENKPDSRNRQYPYGDLSDPAQRADIVFRILHGEENIYKVGDEELESTEPMTPEEIRAALERLRRSITREAAVSHRRLLPLIKDENVVMGCFKPSPEARELARQHGRILRRGVEFPELGQVFYPEDLDALFAKFEVTSVDEIALMFTGKAFVRFETWVVPGRTKSEPTTPSPSPESTLGSTTRAIRAQIPRPPQN
ncbi:MAG: hypothetical protein WCX95_00125 [Candidatus Gracilibacteria bacterium]